MGISDATFILKVFKWSKIFKFINVVKLSYSRTVVF